jgi:hypothetical protein
VYGRIRPNLSVGWCEIRVGGDSHPSSGQLLLGSVDNAAAPGAAFALGGLGLARLDNLGDAVVAVGMAVAAKRPKIKILAQIWCSSSASKLISRKIFVRFFKVECRRCRIEDCSRWNLEIKYNEWLYQEYNYLK